MAAPIDVPGAGTDSPALTRIAAPAARFREEEDIFAAGFVVPAARWQRHATRVREISPCIADRGIVPQRGENRSALLIASQRSYIVAASATEGQS